MKTAEMCLSQGPLIRRPLELPGLGTHAGSGGPDCLTTALLEDWVEQLYSMKPARPTPL